MSEGVGSREWEKFKRWKARVASPELALARQTDLRLFKEKYGVEKGSEFHCPWCFTGRLYYNEEEDYYVCRNCELKFRFSCLDQDKLDALLEARREERRQRREQKKAEGAEPIILPEAISLECPICHTVNTRYPEEDKPIPEFITCSNCQGEIPVIIPDTDEDNE